MNLDRVMGDGLRFVDPDHVEPGWRLDLGPITGESGGHRRAHDGVPAPPDRVPRRRHPGHLPELVALGLGSLACAGLARRTGRRRPGEPFSGELGTADRCPRKRSTPRRCCAASRASPRSVPSRPPTASSPARSSSGRRRPASVPSASRRPASSFWFAGPQPAPPHPFAPSAEGDDVWHVDHARLDEEESTSFDPYAPIVLPVGDDGGAPGWWPWDRGRCSPCSARTRPRSPGRSAPRCRPGRGRTRCWRRTTPAIRASWPRRPRTARLARPLLFFGDPRSLPDEVARAHRGRHHRGRGGSDLTVLVDRHGATLHPMGRVVRPHLQSEETGRAIAELVAPGRRPDPAAPRGPSRSRRGYVTSDGRTPGPRASSTCVSSRRRPAWTGYARTSRPTGPGGRPSWSPTSPCTGPTSSPAIACARACSARRTATPPRRPSSTSRTRRAGPWAPMPAATPCFPPAPATACTGSRPR